MLALEDTQLVTEEEDFKVSVAVGAACGGEEVEEERKEVCEEEVNHVQLQSREYAEEVPDYEASTPMDGFSA